MQVSDDLVDVQRLEAWLGERLPGSDSPLEVDATRCVARHRQRALPVAAWPAPLGATAAAGGQERSECVGHHPRVAHPDRARGHGGPPPDTTSVVRGHRRARRAVHDHGPGGGVHAGLRAATALRRRPDPAAGPRHGVRRRLRGAVQGRLAGSRPGGTRQARWFPRTAGPPLDGAAGPLPHAASFRNSTSSPVGSRTTVLR